MSIYKYKPVINYAEPKYLIKVKNEKFSHQHKNKHQYKKGPAESKELNTIVTRSAPKMQYRTHKHNCKQDH